MKFNQVVLKNCSQRQDKVQQKGIHNELLPVYGSGQWWNLTGGL